MHQGPYLINKWSAGYFDVSQGGNVIVKPNRQNPSGDLFELTKSLIDQGIEAPILIRFNGIIRDRVHALSAAFEKAIKEYSYGNSHRLAYPIKVNPQRHVVEVVQLAGQGKLMGLEVGSKPELIAVMTLETPPDTLLLCNGYKDAEYIALALMATKLGRHTLITIEQPYELKLVLDKAQELGVEANIGIRMKLSHKGTGRWQSSAGENSKFGLFTHEIVACVEKLHSEKKSHWLKLLHFHMGSQITTLESIEGALKEAARMYTELANQHPMLSIFDVGGGLAVDYDGTKGISDSSMNYTLDEYAKTVVSIIGNACKAANVADPTIVTESGRAIVSHHAVLITEVIDVTSATTTMVDQENIPLSHEILQKLDKLQQSLTLQNCRETLSQVLQLKENTLQEFIQGKMSLKERSNSEKLYRSLLVKIHNFYRQLHDIPAEMRVLDSILFDTYFCNLSVFQSLPDSWSVGQLFPIMPIHHLNVEPCHQAILADLSCDSDGKIDTFIGEMGPKPYLNLNEYKGGPYYLGIFLVGAYQEILGGLHNLFGDTNVVHAELDDNGQWDLSRLVEGDTIEEVLNYVQYNTDQLKAQLQAVIEKGLKTGRLTPAESAQIKKNFKQALESYTYLVV